MEEHGHGGFEVMKHQRLINFYLKEEKQYMSNPNNASHIKPLKWYNVFGYGCGDAGGCITVGMIWAFMTRYLQVHLAVNPAILATILLIWNVWDTVNDPLMGTIMDIVFAKSKKGKDKFRPWILASIPVLLFGTVGFFFIPSRMGGGMPMVIALFCLKIVSEAGYTMINIAMGSLLGAMSTNDTERATLSSARGMGSTLGNALTGILVPQLISHFGDNAEGFGYAALVVVPLGVIIVFMHYMLTVERNSTAQQEKSDNAQTKLNLKDIWGIFGKNRAFLALVIHSIAINGVQALGTGMASYMYADVLGDIGLQSSASGLSTVIQVVILISAPILTRKWNMVSIIRFCLAGGICVDAGLLAYMFMTGWAPNAWIYVIVYSIGAGLVVMSVQMQWGLVAEAIDYNEYRTGKRSEGTIYGFFSLSRRLGSTLSGSITVLLIAAIGYDPALTDQGISQAASTIIGIEACNVAFPILAALLSFCCFTFVWNLKGDLSKKIQAWKEGNGPAEYELNK